MFACNGILFNHESPRRGETFVTRKITRAATRIKEGLQQKLYLGNLDAKRDWGFAGDYVEAMWLMLQQDTPDDFVIATGETHSVREFLDEVFGHLESGLEEIRRGRSALFPPRRSGSAPGRRHQGPANPGLEAQVTFKALAKMMTEADLNWPNANVIAGRAGKRNNMSVSFTDRIVVTGGAGFRRIGFVVENPPAPADTRTSSSPAARILT